MAMRFQVRHFFLTRLVDGVLQSDGDVYQIEVTDAAGKQEAMKVAMCLEKEDADIVADALNVALEQPHVQEWAERQFNRWRDRMDELEASLNPTPVPLPESSAPETPKLQAKAKRMSAPTPIRARRWTQD